MKKIFQNIDVIGGLFGLIVVIAVLFEMAINGFDAASVAGGVKDIAGTFVTIILMLSAIRAFIPRRGKGFKPTFEKEMKKIEDKYAPLLKKDESVDGRYNLADRIDALFDGNTGSYHRILDFDYKKCLEFQVSKTVFMGRSKEPFEHIQGRIVAQITNKINGSKDIILNCPSTKTGFKITFKDELSSEEEARHVVDIIDKVVLLYIAENKKN